MPELETFIKVVALEHELDPDSYEIDLSRLRLYSDAESVDNLWYLRQIGLGEPTNRIREAVIEAAMSAESQEDSL